MIRAYLAFASFANQLRSPLLFLIRLFWGSLFIQAGFGKLAMTADVVKYFESLGIPFPELNTYFVSLLEVIGGFALIIGVASRLFALLLVLDMIVAFIAAHLDALEMLASDQVNLTVQKPFSFLFASLVIFVFGPGAASIDRWIRKNNRIV